ncbi:MAG: hypothetical protein CVT48_01310 [Thermoplasmata archaeon HGW-Thermoplasmata-1]|nr:MAG: hypothetical protein CVT48_01310 [Thermoplasmata archaeon HGW-Thermoplasmata-1]
MELLYELSGENETLPRAELEAVLESGGFDGREILSDGRVLVLSVAAKQGREEAGGAAVARLLSSRLSLTHNISHYLGCVLLEDGTDPLCRIADFCRDAAVPAGAFRVTAVRIGDKVPGINRMDVERVAGMNVPSKNIDLKNPDSELLVLLNGRMAYFGTLLEKVNRAQYEARKVEYRPFFSPVSLHPRVARALVNLANVRSGDTLLDPFCGTGGILLEAGLIGLSVAGSDIDKKMVDGCELTLSHYEIPDFTLSVCDIGDAHRVFGKVDAVVTDLPYGQASTTMGEKRTALYRRAFRSIMRCLKKGGYAVVGANSIEPLRRSVRGMNLLSVHACYVHRSMTRYFAVYKKR